MVYSQTSSGWKVTSYWDQIGHMAPLYTGLEDRGNFLDKVEEKMDIFPFGMDSPLVPLGQLGWKDSMFFQVWEGPVEREFCFLLEFED